LLTLPALVGALLLMHGLDVGGATAGSATALAHAATDDHGEAANGHSEEHCADCGVGHMVAACVAVLATFAAVVVRRFHAGRAVFLGIGAAVSRGRPLGNPLRSPEPAWVRLAVMQL